MLKKSLLFLSIYLIVFFTLNVNAQTKARSITGQRVKSGDSYFISYPIKANSEKYLRIKLRHRFSVTSLIKKGLPFIAVSSNNLFGKRQSIPENNHSHSISSYLGPIVTAGAAVSLNSKHRGKAYLNLIYRDRNNLFLKQETHWLEIRKETVIPIKSSVSGSLDVNVVAPAQSDDIIIGTMGIGTCINPSDCEESDIDHGEWGVIGGSGSMEDPFQFADFVVIGHGTGQVTNYGSGYYYYTGGYFNDNFYDPGYYHDISYDPGPQSPTNTHPYFAYEVKDSECEGFKKMLQLQNTLNSEILGLKTNEGKLIILPSIGNTQSSAIVSSKYYDDRGNVIAALYGDSCNGSPCLKVDLISYNVYGQPSSAGTYTISGITHTHPKNHNEPSPQYDLISAENMINGSLFGGGPFNSLQLSFINEDYEVHYNSTGKISTRDNDCN